MQKRRSGTELEKLAFNLEYSFNRGVDLDNRIIQLTEDIEEHHFDHFDSAMTALESLNRKGITIKINSYGGDVHTSLAILGRLLESPCRIHTKGYGKIMSASTAILAAGHKRSISRLATFMHHETSYVVEGKNSEVTHEVEYINQEEQRWNDLMEELTGTPAHYWATNGIGKNLYLTPQKCIDLGIVDEDF
jgi:ATP-dependent protease ClpP protease subunit